MSIKRFLLFTTWKSQSVASEPADDHRHLEIGGYFQAEHTWAGATQETAPLESMFDRRSERIFERFGPH